MRIFEPEWNCDDVIQWLQNHCPDVEQDSEGQILFYTGLFEWGDGSLHDIPENESE